MRALCERRYHWSIVSAVVLSLTLGAARADDTSERKQSSRRRPKVESVNGGSKPKTTTSPATTDSAPSSTTETPQASSPAPVVKKRSTLSLSQQAPEPAKPKLPPVISPTEFANKKETPKASAARETESNPSAAAKEIGVFLRPSKQGDPASDSAITGGEITNAKPSKFQSLTPGVTNLAEVRKSLGEPRERDGDLLEYAVGPFPRVEITLDGDIVRTIVIHLDTASPVATVRKELELGRFKHVDVMDGDGRTLGQAYPERGIAFSYARFTKPHVVAHIMLEPINAEMFMLRARAGDDLQQQLADARFARTMLENGHETYFIESSVLEQLGRFDDAKQAIEKAIKAEPKSKYELIRDRLRWKIGERQAALANTKRIAASPTESKLDQATAACELGDMLAKDAIHNYHGAFEQHTRAITLVEPLTSSEDADTRRAAKRLMIRAHLSVATDLAWGEWRQKEIVIPKWTSIAQQAAQKLIDKEGASERLLLTVNKRILQAYAGLDAELKQDRIAQDTIELGRKLIDATKDPLTKRAIQWELAEALYYGSRSAQRRRAFSQAIQLGENAAALIDTASKDLQLTSSQRYLAARIKFQIGSVHALDHQAHDDAISWYDQAIKHFGEIDAATFANCGSIGDRLVSMGVSYWQSGKREYALAATQRGAELLQVAVDEGWRKPTSLAIPFNNLASMHEVLGNEERAKEFAKLSDQHQESSASRSTGAPPASRSGGTEAAGGGENRNSARRVSARPTSSSTTVVKPAPVETTDKPANGSTSDSTGSAEAASNRPANQENSPESTPTPKKPHRRRPPISKKIRPSGRR